MRDRKTGGDGKLVLCLISLVIGGVLAVSYFNRAGDEPPKVAAEPEPVFEPRPVTFAPGLHVLEALAPSVAYVVETTEGLILIDTGLEDAHELLLRQFDMLGLDIQDLKRILLTHGHGDHYLGAVALQQRTGAKIYVGRGDADVLRDAGPREAVFSTFPMDHVRIHKTPVDVELTGGETIASGDARIQVIATPGHTPGSICYLLERHGRTALFSGDTIMTITGDLGTYSTYLPPRYRGDARDYLTSLRKLARFPVPDLLLPGHPRTGEGVVSARISQQEWSSLLSQGISKMEELTEHYASDGADFLDGNPKELVAGVHYLGDFSGMAVYCFVDQSSFVLFDAPGGPELVGFLEAQLSDIKLDLSMLQAVALTGADPESAGGLGALIGKTGCRVIAAESDAEYVRKISPNVTVLLPEAAGDAFDWLPLQPIPVDGFGKARTAWRIEWKGTQILVSGRIPLKPDERAVQALQVELQQVPFDGAGWIRSLNRLNQVPPDLWLPARPMNGQLANLYGSDWQDILRQNRLSLGLDFQ